MSKITPFLWFDNQLEEAMAHYLSIFSNSRVVSVSRAADGGPGRPGAVTSATFELEGQQFMALNVGAAFTFTPAISLFVSCETQDELDHLWNRLLEGGEAQRCGWLKDKFGLSWQIIPTALGAMLQDPDREKAQRAMRAMLSMVKLDIELLQRAFDGR
jgi:predicted 3-demethylubiquinone-9 3-methyltransferase (glyoxalase superfamily)